MGRRHPGEETGRGGKERRHSWRKLVSSGAATHTSHPVRSPPYYVYWLFVEPSVTHSIPRRASFSCHGTLLLKGSDTKLAIIVWIPFPSEAQHMLIQSYQLNWYNSRCSLQSSRVRFDP
jgi:hypothetical protein